MQLADLIKQNRTNHYKMLVIVDNSRNPHKLIDPLKGEGWTAHDVNHTVLQLLQDLPPDKVKVRIAGRIKEWVLSLPDKGIFFNGNILYSPEFGKLNPVGAFKYRSRSKEIIVILEGQLMGNRVVYSEYGRPDYTEMDVSELICVRMEDIYV